jgi:membrane-bound lytic murein transglycosylase D
MDDQKRTLFSSILLVAGLVLPGCTSTQHARFQMSFLPPSPLGAAAPLEIDSPPDVQPNLYLRDVPPFLSASPQAPERRSRADAMVQRAGQRFQRGKKYYQANDLPNARREFDTAIDLMLDASDQNPADRQEYDRGLDEMVDAIHRLDLSGMGASATFEEGKFEKAPLEDILEMTFPVDPRLKDRVRDQVAATVSQLPLASNDAVLGYINYFSKSGHKTIVAAYQRSGRYRPMIQRILDEEGVPQELIHLAQAESGFIPRAVSRAAAGGMWQFLAWRGQQYGLMRTAFTDDRMDPEKATRAAAHHLHDLYSEFGDWYLAIAAYNCGPVVVEKAVERTGYADFWELRNRGVLPRETTNYVPIILAMTIMEKNGAEYGLEGVALDPPLEYDTVETSSPTSLALVADIADAPLTEVAALNSAVLKGIAPADFSLRVPKGSGNQVMAALQVVPPEHRDAWRMHRVGPGETLAAIAQRYKTSPGAIASANQLVASAETVEGDRLMIPALHPAAAPVSRTPSRAPARRARAVRQAHAAPASKAPAPVQQARAGALRRSSRPASKSAPRTPVAARTASLRPAHKQPVMVAEGSAR